MTPAQRLDEFRSWSKVLEIDFNKVHQRIEELVGRPVFTHELGSSGVESLEAEILTGEHCSLEEVIAKLPADKPVVLVEVENAQ